MKINFDKYAEAGKEFVNKMAFELGDEKNTLRVGRLIRSTLHALRDQSTVEESMQFLGQLPMAIKAIYVDGWDPASRKNHFRHLDEFTAAVEKNGGFQQCENSLEKLHDIQSVIHVMAEYVSDGEMDDFRKTMPKELRILLNDRTR